jgi:hypothetical protein
LWQENGVKKMESYLRVHGIHTKTIVGIMECDMQAGNNRQQTQEQAASRIVKPKHPEKFIVRKFPPSWVRGVAMTTHIDVVMHLLFFGVVKTVIIMVQEWAKIRGKNTFFISYMEGTLDSIQSLGLDWCQCIPYSTGKLGGWISEAARVICWMYSFVQDIVPDAIYKEPKKEQHKWTQKENQQWLQMRALDSTGNAATVCERVMQYMQLPSGPPYHQKEAHPSMYPQWYILYMLC